MVSKGGKGEQIYNVIVRLNSGTIARIGNAIKASTSGSEWEHTAMLLDNEVAQDGVVFAFSAFFISNKSVQFEIWRPTSNTDDFTLIGGWTFKPSVKNNLEIVSIELSELVSL